jgi:RsiW-degrading membrane proteinase PrsW (M82 family)
MGLLALLGALPALVAMAIFDWIDRKRPEPRSKLRLVTVLGALSVIPCGILEIVLVKVTGINFGAPSSYLDALVMSFVVAAAVEEGAKLVVLRFVAWRFRAFDERLDGIVYATRAALGFAAVENIGYLALTHSAGTFIAMFLGRAILTVPMHALSAAMMGHYGAQRRFDGTGPGLAGGYALAVLLHGVFDGAVFVMLVAARQKELGLAVLMLPVPFIALVLAWRFVRRLARQALEGDDAASLRARELGG